MGLYAQMPVLVGVKEMSDLRDRRPMAGSYQLAGSAVNWLAKGAGGTRGTPGRAAGYHGLS